MSELRDRLSKIQSWIQQEDDELFYTPDGAEPQEESITFHQSTRIHGIRPGRIIFDEFDDSRESEDAPVTPYELSPTSINQITGELSFRTEEVEVLEFYDSREVERRVMQDLELHESVFPEYNRRRAMADELQAAAQRGMRVGHVLGELHNAQVAESQLPYWKFVYVVRSRFHADRLKRMMPDISTAYVIHNRNQVCGLHPREGVIVCVASDRMSNHAIEDVLFGLSNHGFITHAHPDIAAQEAVEEAERHRRIHARDWMNSNDC